MSCAVSKSGGDELGNYSLYSVGCLCADVQMNIAVKMPRKNTLDDIGTVCDHLINLACHGIACIATHHTGAARGSVAKISRITGGITQMHGIFRTEFTVMAGCMLGGVKMGGGGGKMSNMVVGVLIIGVLNSGMNFLNMNQYWKYVVLGIALLAAVTLDTMQTRAAIKAAKKVSAPVVEEAKQG